MNLSSAAIESMGFARIASQAPIVAAFYSLHVFEVRGFSAKDVGIVSSEGSVSGVPFKIAIGHSLNEACLAVTGDSYTDDEENWREKKKCTPPYVLVQIGPTDAHQATTGYVKVEADSTITYDSFPIARRELRDLEAKALPSLELGLACAFNSDGHGVSFAHVDRVAFGLTPDGLTIHDLRVTGTASAYASVPMGRAEMVSSLGVVAVLADSIHPRVGTFFQLGKRDRDDLKRFLYFFLALEIEVHRVFAKTTREQHLGNVATFNARVTEAAGQLFESKEANWVNLADRFVWCVASTWKHLADGDISEFRRLKRMRDRIAHGVVAGPDRDSVVAVERLLRRVVGG